MKLLEAYIFNKTATIVEISKHNWVEKNDYDFWHEVIVVVTENIFLRYYSSINLYKLF
jgi:ABC-type transport system involved in Fe-S cluster assembly fused permease/ATPase subunit